MRKLPAGPRKGRRVLFLIPYFAIGTLLECWNLTLLERQIALRKRRWLSAALLAGLLVMATAGALFMYLADEIGEQAWLTQIDLAVAQFFHPRHPLDAGELNLVLKGVFRRVRPRWRGRLEQSQFEMSVTLASASHVEQNGTRCCIID
jgi:hypothetical protein